MPRFLAAAVLLPLLLAPATRADDTATIAKNLAENILGRGLVRASRVIDEGRAVQMVWESATFKPAHTQAHARELLQAEAQLASGAIFHVLRDVRGVQFEIVLGQRSLCTGRASRDRPFQIRYARDLGG